MIEKDNQQLIEDEDFEDFNSQYVNCYVYELFVKSTGEIYYVGYDSDEERDEPMDNYPTHRDDRDLISKYHETEERILKTGLREAWADYYVEKRIDEISNDNMLYSSENLSLDHVIYYEGITPKLEVSHIEQHYLGMEPISFDKVNVSNLKVVFLDVGYLGKKILVDLYGNRYFDYYSELKNKLEAIGSKILASPYAKSITAWIQLGGSGRRDYEKTQERAMQKLGHNIPIYHIFDVLNALKDIDVDSINQTCEGDIDIHPIHNRCPLSDIRNFNDFHAGFREGFPYYQKGEKLRLQGNIDAAIALFDKARESGYDAPALYRSYESVYRQIKDYDNEIAILVEYRDRTKAMHENDSGQGPFWVEMEEKINKAKKRLIKSKDKK